MNVDMHEGRKEISSGQICRRIAATLTIAFAMCAFQSRCETWDETRYEYDPGTGNLLKKIYPDGHQIFGTNIVFFD